MATGTKQRGRKENPDENKKAPKNSKVKIQKKRSNVKQAGYQFKIQHLTFNIHKNNKASQFPERLF